MAFRKEGRMAGWLFGWLARRGMSVIRSQSVTRAQQKLLASRTGPCTPWTEPTNMWRKPTEPGDSRPADQQTSRPADEIHAHHHHRRLFVLSDPSHLRMATPVRILVTVGTTRFDALIGTVLSARFLSALPNGAHVTVQYGRSSIGEILATSSLVDIDAGSSLEPEPGLRVVNGRRVYQHRLASLDPGHTGTVRGLQIRPGPNGIEGAFQATTPEGVELDMFPFAPDLGGYMKQVDVVISHAGKHTNHQLLSVRLNWTLT